MNPRSVSSQPRLVGGRYAGQPVVVVVHAVVRGGERVLAPGERALVGEQPIEFRLGVDAQAGCTRRTVRWRQINKPASTFITRSSGCRCRTGGSLPANFLEDQWVSRAFKVNFSPIHRVAC